MITIETSLKEISNLIAGLEQAANDLHKQSIRSYPDDDYQTPDKHSIDCYSAVNFFRIAASVKELELDIMQLKLDNSYLNSRLDQLEAFLQVDQQDSHSDDIITGMTAVSRSVIENKHKISKLEAQTFLLEIPDSIKDCLAQQGFLNLSEF